MLVHVKTLAPKISSCEHRARVTGEFSEVLCMLEGLTQAFCLRLWRKKVIDKLVYVTDKSLHIFKNITRFEKDIEKSRCQSLQHTEDFTKLTCDPCTMFTTRDFWCENFHANMRHKRAFILILFF